MSEGNKRGEFSVPGVPHPVRVKEEALLEEGPSAEMQQRAQALGGEMRREREEQEKSGKVNMEEAIAKRGEREMQEFRERELRLWKARGGTAAEFDSEWPRIKSDHIRRENEELYRKSYSVYD